MLWSWLDCSANRGLLNLRRRPQVSYQRWLGFKWVGFKQSKTGVIEKYALYSIDKNEIWIWWGFIPRDKAIALGHEFMHFLNRQFPELMANKFDDWLDRLTKFLQERKVINYHIS